MRITFLGCGNMAKAMIRGILRTEIVTADEIVATAKTDRTLKQARKQFSIQTEKDNKKAIQGADIVVLAIKPQYYADVIEEIRAEMEENQIVVTIAPGWTLERTEKALNRTMKIVRTMPNMPSMIGEGMTAVCPNARLTEKEMETVLRLMESFGRATVIEESMFDGVTAISGSSPAYVYMMIEAMADAGVREGVPRKQAYELVAQAVLGSAKMVLETGKHPAELKDMVCSPAGTTIEAVRTLEERGFRSSLIEAVKVCADKARNV